MKNILYTIAILLAIPTQVWSQAYDLQFIHVLNEGKINGNFDVKIQIKSNTGDFNLGLSNITFDFNTAGLFSGAEPDNGSQSPELMEAHNFTSGYYSPQNLTEPQRGSLSLNINYHFETPNKGATIGTNWIDVATIRFKIRNINELAGLEWRGDQATGVVNPVIINSDALPLNTISRNSVSNSNSPLPVELMFFKAKKIENNVVLNWATAVEVNCDNFEIQRSTDAVEWETIGSSACVSMSFNTRNYSFNDNQLTNKVNFYRLKQNDLNGEYAYSNIVVVNIDFRDVSDLIIYPNPANSFVTIATENGFLNDEIKVYNSQGQLVFNQFINDSKVLVDISHLPSGMYFVRMDNQNIQKTFLIN